MNTKKLTTLAALALTTTTGVYFAMADQHEESKWKVHDESRPKPTVIQPGTFPTAEQPSKAPSDALILFDGKDISHWQAEGGGEPTWKVGGGFMEAAGGKGLMTKEAFGDCQLHVEWASPDPAKGEGQGRGNSGVYIMGHYEVQVLDSFKNETYADGQAAALYGQYPPLVNASLPPGQWQTYDIVFHRPHFDAQGKAVKPATMTVFHNGVLVQDHAVLKGTTAHKSPGQYWKHADKLPIHLQFHGDPVRYRNIWIRQLPELPSH